MLDAEPNGTDPTLCAEPIAQKTTHFAIRHKAEEKDYRYGYILEEFGKKVKTLEYRALKIT